MDFLLHKHRGTRYNWGVIQDMTPRAEEGRTINKKTQGLIVKQLSRDDTD